MRSAFSSTWPIASGQDSTLSPFCRSVEWQRMPRSCSMSVSGLMPARSAVDTRRLVASLCEGQPPARPRLVNTSQMPCSS